MPKGLSLHVHDCKFQKDALRHTSTGNSEMLSSKSGIASDCVIERCDLDASETVSRVLASSKYVKMALEVRRVTAMASGKVACT